MLSRVAVLEEAGSNTSRCCSCILHAVRRCGESWHHIIAVIPAKVSHPLGKCRLSIVTCLSSGVRAQDLGSTIARFQDALSPGPCAANPDPDLTPPAEVPALLLALRGGDGRSSPRARAPGAPQAEVPATGPASPEPPARRSGLGSRPAGGARMASRLPWVLGADPDPGSQGGGQDPAAVCDAGVPCSGGGAPGAGGCASAADPAAPACLAPACNLRTCSDDEDLEVRKGSRAMWWLVTDSASLS